MEAEVLQKGQEFLREHMLLTEILNVILRKTHILHILNDLLQSSEDSKAAPVRILAIEHIKNHLGLRVVVIEIAVGHSHLVEIHHHGNVAFIKLGHGRLLCCIA